MVEKRDHGTQRIQSTIMIEKVVTIRRKSTTGEKISTVILKNTCSLQIWFILSTIIFSDVFEFKSNCYITVFLRFLRNSWFGLIKSPRRRLFYYFNLHFRILISTRQIFPKCIDDNFQITDRVYHVNWKGV